MSKKRYLPVLLLSLLSPSAMPGTAGPACGGGGEEPRGGGEQAARRLLMTGSGEILRGLTRRGPDGVWELLGSGGWLRVDGPVLASPLEEAVLEKASRMQARIDPGDGARLRALAGWMAHQGLEEESLGLMMNSDQSQI